MDPLIAQARAILELVRADGAAGSENPLGGKHMALLAQATLAHIGITASPIYTQLQAVRNNSIKFTMDIEVLDLRLPSGVARMNMFGDTGEDAIPGIVRRWELSCNTTWAGKPVSTRWRALDRQRWSQTLPEDYFEQRAGALLANAQAEILSDQVPGLHSLNPRIGPRL